MDRGAPEGNPADMPPPRQFSDLDKWHIGKPDIVVSMTKPYELKANGQDEYYDIDIDPGFTGRHVHPGRRDQAGHRVSRWSTTPPPT